jgi:adenylate cyclase class 2
MLEIEIKSKISSPPEIEKKIIDLGGKFYKEVFEEDLYFNHPGRDFSKTDEALRLRKVEGKYFLTYKGPKLDKLTKTREEFNLEVSDWESALEIFKSLGFNEVSSVEKERRIFKIRDYLVMIDHLKGLGDFIEVEKKGEYDPNELIDFLKSLGVEGSETRSYLEMLLELKMGK